MIKEIAARIGNEPSAMEAEIAALRAEVERLKAVQCDYTLTTSADGTESHSCGCEGMMRALRCLSAAPDTSQSADADTCIDVAREIEKLRAEKIVEAVSLEKIGGSEEVLPTQFHAGYQLACEEILHRLRTEQWGPSDHLRDGTKLMQSADAEDAARGGES